MGKGVKYNILVWLFIFFLGPT